MGGSFPFRLHTVMTRAASACHGRRCRRVIKSRSQECCVVRRVCLGMASITRCGCNSMRDPGKCNRCCLTVWGNSAHRHRRDCAAMTGRTATCRCILAQMIGRTLESGIETGIARCVAKITGRAGNRNMTTRCIDYTLRNQTIPRRGGIRTVVT